MKKVSLNILKTLLLIALTLFIENSYSQTNARPGKSLSVAEGDVYTREVKPNKFFEGLNYEEVSFTFKKQLLGHYVLKTKFISSSSRKSLSSGAASVLPLSRIELRPLNLTRDSLARFKTDIEAEGFTDPSKYTIIFDFEVLSDAIGRYLQVKIYARKNDSASALAESVSRVTRPNPCPPCN
jgi:hypothetical protein